MDMIKGLLLRVVGDASDIEGSAALPSGGNVNE